jgi:hypothetical protein
MPISVTCPCGKRLRVKDELAGKRVKCPGCGAVLPTPNSPAAKVVTLPKAPSTAASAVPDQPTSHAGPAEIQAHCPKCNARLKTDMAKQCFACGHDWHPIEQRKPIEPTEQRKPTPREVEEHRIFGIAGAVVGIGFTIWTIYLLSNGFTWWVVLTGLLGFTGWVMLLSFLTTDAVSFAKLGAGSTNEPERRGSGSGAEALAGLFNTMDSKGAENFAKLLNQMGGSKTGDEKEEGTTSQSPATSASPAESGPAPAKFTTASSSSKEKGAEPTCAGCGKSKARIQQDQADLKKKGVMVFTNPSGPLLHCDQCSEYYCGRCAVDSGMEALCPRCNKVIG